MIAKKYHPSCGGVNPAAAAPASVPVCRDRRPPWGAQAPTQPYALAAAVSQPFAGRGDGALFFSADRGESRRRPQPSGEPLPSVLASQVVDGAQAG